MGYIRPLSRGVDLKLCKRVVKIRLSTGLSQSKFAKLMGCSRANQSAIECCRQNPTPFYVRRLFYDFNIDMNWLFMGVGSMNAGEYQVSVDELKEEVTHQRRLLKQLSVALEKKDKKDRARGRSSEI